MSDPAARTWVDVPPGSAFGIDALPYGSGALHDDPGRPRVLVAIGAQVLDLSTAVVRRGSAHAPLFAAGTLDPLLAAGPAVWDAVRAEVHGWLSDEGARGAVEPLLAPASEVTLRLPFAVADYVDFYASEDHAANVGRILRPGQPSLPGSWKHLPAGYHGRAGTVVVSGTPVRRPAGQRRDADGSVVVGPTTRLDLEAELGFVVGVPSQLGTPVALSDVDRHVFGVCLVNDWSARDIQAFEYVPLGPFVGKSFATSVSPWILPLAALSAARVAPPPRDPLPVAYLDDRDAPPWGLDVRLEVRLNGHVISRPPARRLYWTVAQQVAHLTVGGASLRTGDLLASGTVSGPERGERGCLLELSWGGAEPLVLPDGSSRTFLEDGDEIEISGVAPGPAGLTIGLGAVQGRVVGADPHAAAADATGPTPSAPRSAPAP